MNHGVQLRQLMRTFEVAEIEENPNHKYDAFVRVRTDFIWILPIAPFTWLYKFNNPTFVIQRMQSLFHRLFVSFFWTRFYEHDTF